MTMWFYQLSEDVWSIDDYRVDVWEGELRNWETSKPVNSEDHPGPGEKIVFFYAPSRAKEWGIVGWGIVLSWTGGDIFQLRFRPVAPSDRLKMRPWCGKRVKEIATKVRGRVSQGTLWLIERENKNEEDFEEEISQGILQWVAGGDGFKPTS